MNYRRLLLVLAFFAFVIAAAFAIYYLFFRVAPTPATNANQNINGGVLPSTNGNVNRIIGDVNGGVPIVNGANANVPTNVNASPIADGGITAVSAVLPGAASSVNVSSASGTITWYDPTTGKFYAADADGKNVRELSSQLFPNAQSITWNKQGNKAVVMFPDSSKILYDFNSKKQYTLPKESDNYSFSPSGDQIAYKYLPQDANDRYIVTSNPDGSSVKFIEKIGDQANDVNVSWSPTSQVVATYRKSVDANSQEVYFIGQNKENFKSAVTEGRGFQGMWSPDGSKMLYSVYNADTQYNPSLYIMSASGDDIGGGRTGFQIQTWPDKCAFSSSGDKVYCAVPKFLDPGSGLQAEASVITSDQFYSIDIVSGNSQLIALPASQVSAGNMFLGTDGKTLYFTNSLTGQLESIKLP